MKKSIILFSFIFIHKIIFAIPTTIIENIHINQFGYKCNDQKIAVVSSKQSGFYGTSFTAGTATNNYQLRQWDNDVVVFTGTLSTWNGGATHTQSGDIVWWFDFSTFNTPGTYYVFDVAQNKASYKFEIKDQIYKDVLVQCTRSYYYQRCGNAKAMPYVSNAYIDAACHIGSLQDTHCRLYNNNVVATEKNVSGGWHDAGDYNKYVNFALPAVVDLCLAYEENKPIWSDNFNIPESGNGQADILDEIKYETDWLLKMQQSNGSVLSVVGVAGFASASPPSADVAQRFYGPATTSASFSAAAMFAIAAIQFNSAGNTTYGTILQTAAINAITWANANPGIQFYNSGIIAAGEQEVSGYDLEAIQMQANIYVNALAPNATYKNYIETNVANMHLQAWGYVYPFENAIQDALLYYTKSANANATTVTTIKSNYQTSIQTNNADNLLAYTNSTDAYRAYLSDQNYTTGSNNTKAHQGIILHNSIQYNLDNSNNTNYKNAGSGYLHYLMGVNPTGFCYITNMAAFGAEKSVPEFYHGWFNDGNTLYDRVGTSTYGPPPGFIPSGTNPTYSLDGCCPNGCGSTANNALCNTALVTPPLGQPIQKAYKDFNTNWPQNSWNVSETGIYYEASVLRLISQFVDMNTCAVTAPLTIDSSSLFIPKANNSVSDFLIYPNPTDNILNVNIHSLKEQNIILTIKNNLGEIVLSKNLFLKNENFNTSFNVQNYASGIYEISISNYLLYKSIKWVKN